MEKNARSSEQQSNQAVLLNQQAIKTTVVFFATNKSKDNAHVALASSNA